MFCNLDRGNIHRQPRRMVWTDFGHKQSCGYVKAEEERKSKASKKPPPLP